MTTPSTAGPFTSRLYDRLPETFRDLDEGLELLRYVAVAAGDADQLERLADRVADDLTDPSRADPAWLPWLAQHVGATLPADASEDVRREVLRSGAGGFRGGTRESIVVAARRALTGTRSAHVVPSSADWIITLRTIPSETTTIDAVRRAVEQAGALPAGFDLVVTFYAASWDTLEARYTSSASWDAVATWGKLEETGSSANQTGPSVLGEGAWGEGALG